MEIQTLYNLKSKFVTREVGDELIIVPLSGNVAQMNELFTLNETAKVIWENLREDTSFEDLQRLITETFDIDAQTAAKDIDSFLIRLDSLLNKK
ncbi:MAG: PqqD family protein [Paludibacter sp.]